MDKARGIDRRSFLARVAGGAAVAGAGLIFGASDGEAAQKATARTKTREMLVDSDPGDPARPVPRPRRRPHQGFSTPQPPMPQNGTGISSTGNGRSNGPVQRFVICPGNVRCPRRSP